MNGCAQCIVNLWGFKPSKHEYCARRKVDAVLQFHTANLASLNSLPLFVFLFPFFLLFWLVNIMTIG